MAHIFGQGGSYISMTTALLVVNWEDLTGESVGGDPAVGSADGYRHPADRADDPRGDAPPAA